MLLEFKFFLLVQSSNSIYIFYFLYFSVMSYEALAQIGLDFLELCRRDTVSREDELNLASFLGVQLRNLHLLPYPHLNISTFSDIEQESGLPFTNVSMEDVSIKSNIPAEWDIFIRTLSKKKKDVSSRLIKWYFYYFY